MRYLYLTLIAFLSLFHSNGFSQTTFWSDDFDAPSGGVNNNNAGAGWSGNTFTPGGGQNTSFIGISNAWIIGTNAGACASGSKLYVKSLGAGNSYLSDIFSDILNASPAISTVGYTSINLSFNWRCDGVPGQDYGLVGLSDDGGSTWNWLPTNYSGQETCTNASISIPSTYEGIPNFKVAFRFISNSTSCSTCDPPFNIDNITLTGTSGGCTPPTADAGISGAVCLGDPGMEIGGAPTASNGSGSYSYAWTPTTGLDDPNIANPTANPSLTTTYTVLVTDLNGNCTATDQVTVTVNNPQPLATTPLSIASFCQGSFVSLSANAGFTNYSWSTPTGTVSGQTIDAQTAGDFTVSANDVNGCLSTASAIAVTENTPATLGISFSGSTLICAGSTTTLSAASGFTDYTWTTPAGSQSTQSIDAVQGGVYQVSALDANGCQSTSSTITLNLINPQVLTANLSGTISLCEGESVTLTAAAGFSGYIWSTPSLVIPQASIDATLPGIYSVSALDANGCTSFSEDIIVNVTIPELLSINNSGSLTFCDGGSIDLSATSGFTNYIWTTPEGNETGINIEAGDAGDYSVTAIDVNGCPSVSESVTVSVIDALPISTSPEESLSICPSEQVQLDAEAGFTNYVWTTPAGSLSGQTVQVDQAGDYSVSAIDMNGCTSESDVVVISIANTVSLSISPSGPIDLCPGSTVTLNVATGFTDYQWNGEPGTSSLEVSEAGSYSVTATSPSGCPATSETSVVSILPQQTVLISPAGPLTICEGESIQLDAEAGFTNYVWVTPEGNEIGSSIQAATEGNYSLSAIDANGCTSVSENIIVNVNTPELLSINYSGSLTFCDGQSIDLSATSGFTNYVWVTPEGDENGSTLEAGDPGIYSVSAIDANGCSSVSEDITITVNEPLPLSTNPEGNVSICPGEQVQILATTGFTNYTWNTPAGTLSGPSVQANQAGEYSVTAIDINGCTSVSDIVSIAIANTVSLAINPSGSINLCPGSTITLNAATGFTNYLWNGEPGSSSFVVSESGVYTVTAISSSGCPAISEAVDVTLLTQQTVSISPLGPLSICAGESIQLNADAGFTNYSWTSPEGILNGMQISANVSGDYTIQAEDANGCAALSSTVNLTVNTPLPLTITPGGNIEICPGSSVTLTTDGQFSNYSWDGPSGVFNTQNLTTSTEGEYSVSALDVNGCLSSSEIVSVSTLILPELNVSPQGPLVVCPNLTVTLLASGNFSSFEWSDGIVLGETYTVTEAGSYFVEATTSEGCVVTSVVTDVSFFPEPPPISISPAGPFELCEGQQVVLNAQSGFSNYIWNTNDTTLSISANVSGSYVVSANDQNGCVSSSNSVSVNVQAPFEISTNPSGPINICPGESISITAENGYFDYQWSNSFMGQTIEITEPGTYSVSVNTKNGCPGGSQDIIVNQLNAPVASFTYAQGDGYLVNFSNTSQSSTSFLWDFGNGGMSQNPNPSHTFPFDNDWPVTLIATNECGSDTLNTFVTVIKTGINDFANWGISVAQIGSELQISSSKTSPGQTSIRLINLEGKLVIDRLSENLTSESISLNGLAAGVYILTIQNTTNSYHQKLLISNK